MDVLTVVLTLLLCFFLSKLFSFISQLDGHQELGSSEEVAAKVRGCSSKGVGGLGVVADVVEVPVLSDTEHANSHLQQPRYGSCGSKEMEQQPIREIPVGVKKVDESAENGAGYSEFIVQASTSDGCGSPEIAHQSTEKISLRVNTVDESVQGENYCGTEVGWVKDELGISKREEEVEISESENKSEEPCMKEEQLEEEDDWEGIESTQLDRVFGAAVCFVGCGSNADQISKLANDIKMQMYGLHKVATEGPCHRPRPMALKVSARAKWNAWQKVGDMSQEEAMEQYVYLLSRSIPGWMQDNTGISLLLKHDSVDSKESRNPSSSDMKTFPANQATAVDDRSFYEMMA